MSARVDAYTTELIKVAGIVSESIELLQIWEPGMTSARLRDAALAKGTLSKESADRVWVMVRYGFGLRYLSDGQRPARYLKRLVDGGAPVPLLRQLFTVYTARINGLFADVAGDWYWRRIASGAAEIDGNGVKDFIRGAFGTPKALRPWSEAGTSRVASGVIKTLADFGFLAQAPGAKRAMTPPRILPQTILFLAYEARARGLSDASILADRSWALFGLDPQEVLAELKRLSGSGFLIVQSSGDLVRLTFQHPTMEEFLDALVR